MGKTSPCYSCENKNVYEPKYGYFACNYSGRECNNKDFPMYRPRKQIVPELPKDGEINMSCPYCHEDRDGYVIPIEKNCHAYIVFPDTLRLKFDRQARECKINYCPMCGRKLGWDEP